MFSGSFLQKYSKYNSLYMAKIPGRSLEKYKSEVLYHEFTTEDTYLPNRTFFLRPSKQILGEYLY
jgi:hypothetical protein